jgi:multiple sugar transport system ATP-binding protein
VGLRPESIVHGGEGQENPDGADGLRLTVRLVEELGADAYVYGALPGDSPADKAFTVRFSGRVPPRIGETLTLSAQHQHAHAFHPQTGERLAGRTHC